MKLPSELDSSLGWITDYQYQKTTTTMKVKEICRSTENVLLTILRGRLEARLLDVRKRFRFVSLRSRSVSVDGKTQSSFFSCEKKVLVLRTSPPACQILSLSKLDKAIFGVKFDSKIVFAKPCIVHQNQLIFLPSSFLQEQKKEKL